MQAEGGGLRWPYLSLVPMRLSWLKSPQAVCNFAVSLVRDYRHAAAPTVAAPAAPAAVPLVQTLSPHLLPRESELAHDLPDFHREFRVQEGGRLWGWTPHGLRLAADRLLCSAKRALKATEWPHGSPCEDL